MNLGNPASFESASHGAGQVMAQQQDLLEIVAELKQIICVKG